jgi:hypothetical protein
MKNTTVVIATTCALVAAGLTVEMTRRHTNGEAKWAASIAEAETEAPVPIAKADGATKPEAREVAKQASVPEDVGSEKPLAVQAPAQATLTEPAVKAQGDSQPMRDASPPAPYVALVNADPGSDGQSIVKPNDEKTSERQPALFAIPQGGRRPAPDAEAKDHKQPKATGEAKKSKSVNDTAFVKPAIVKSGRGKSEAEKATIDHPADAPKRDWPCETHHRLAKRHSVGGDAEQRRSERYAAARAIPTVKWQGEYGGPEPHPLGDVYAFSGSFGGCRYHGSVSMSGYRIESSC